jgi:Fe-S-cluster-containing hydrogenase component 2
LIDSEKCIGCNACVFICPFGAIIVDRSARIATVCDMCDGDPLCVKFCPWGALEYVKCDDVSIRVKRNRAEKLLYLLQSSLAPVEQTS